MTDEATATIPTPIGDPFVVRITGTPISWKRAQQGRGGAKYTDPKVAGYQRVIRAEVDQALRAAGHFHRPVFAKGEAVAMDVVAAYPRPAKATYALPLSGYADADNAAKAAMDALNGLAYADDAQVARLTVAKAYVDGEGFLEVTLWDVHVADVPRDPMLE